MTKGIENNKLTAEGLQDVKNLIEVAECYKAEAPVKDPDGDPAYWTQLPVRDIIDELLQADDLEAEWKTTGWTGFDSYKQLESCLSAEIKRAGWAVKNQTVVYYDGEEGHYTLDCIILN